MKGVNKVHKIETSLLKQRVGSLMRPGPNNKYGRNAPECRTKDHNYITKKEKKI